MDILAAFRAKVSDRDWRLQNLYLIEDERAGIRPFEARPEQLEFRRNRHFRNFIPKARKLGMSTEVTIENLDDCLFIPRLNAAIVDRTEGDAVKKLGIARLAWERGPVHPNQAIAQLWRWLHQANPLVKDTDSVMQWKNGSSIEAGVSFTGGTLQRLHVSELGPIAAQKPAKAAEIRRGSLNAVPPDGIITIETTMEGGRFGVCYDFFKLALSTGGRQDLNAGQWRLHFFPWVNHPSYVLPGSKPVRPETFQYFRELEEKRGLTVSLERQAWYEAKKLELREEIWQQFPTIIEECDRAQVAGAIYPEMIRVRSEGRVKTFPFEPGVPFYSFWDLGSAENRAGWLIQPTRKDINVMDWCAGGKPGAEGMAEQIRAWEREHGPIAGHFLPHDADITDKGAGRTYKQQLIDCGIPAHLIFIVPRIPKVTYGISEVRARLGRMWFHERCDRTVVSDTGEELPGGIGRLEAYRWTPITASGVQSDAPLPDFCSHSADALRTFAEADSRGLIVAAASYGREPERRESTVKLAGWR
jgi:hypothetical protein